MNCLMARGAGVQTVAVRTYVFVIDAALRTPFRVRIGAIAAAGIVAGSIAGCLWLGLPGLCLGVLAGRVVQCVALPVFVRSRVLRGVAPRTPTSRALRAVTVTAGIFLGAAWLGSRVTAAHWVTWGVASIGTMMALTLSAYVLGLDAEVRRALASRLADVARLRLSAGRQP